MRTTQTLLAAMAAMHPELMTLIAPIPEPKQPRIYTHADEERQRKAEAKRQRKAAKRAASKESGND
jgi:hypothetical protein